MTLEKTGCTPRQAGVLNSQGTVAERDAYLDGTHSASRPSVASCRGRARARRRWAINGDFLLLRPTGVARYAREVTKALDALHAEGHPLVDDLDLQLIAPRAGGIVLDAIEMIVLPEFRHPRVPQLWVQAQLPRHVRGGLVSFCNLAPLALRKQIACIHDLQTRTAPESYGRLFRLMHHVMLPLLCRRAARITTVSEFSKGQLIQFGVAPAGTVRIACNGSDHVNGWNAARSTLSDVGRPFALCLGRNQPHKNVGLMVRLAPLLDSFGLDLWIAGAVDREVLERDGQILGPNVRLLGRISDDDFKKALSEAVCFLFPSRSEGFGLPAVEAMAAGCPVVSSTAACLREVCGNAALYGDPDDVEGWASEVLRLKTTPSLRDSLVSAGREQAARFTWRQTAMRYLELMREVDDEEAGHGVRGRAARFRA